MTNVKFNTALIVGAGSGLSASLARALAKDGIKVALAARTTGDLDGLVKEVGARAFACDATKRGDVDKLFADVDASLGAPDIVIYNASFRTRGPFVEIDPLDVEKALAVTAYGAFLVAQQAARRMLPKKHGAILLTGASAGVKGYPQSAPFAMGKFALRGLAQSMARELAPKNVHVAHFIIDGGIERPNGDARAAGRAADALLKPEAIAESYLAIHRQHRSAWSWELELRPWVETF
jgi:NAD(P)-dependent dehydrogenase (short-subunit alcohol dehydrogenase family)